MGLLLFIFFPSGEAEGSLAKVRQPIPVGERLTYRISWSHITAGTAVMAVVRMDEARDQVLAKLVTTVQSSSFITWFFPVDNRIESELNLAAFVPEYMTFKRREGKKKEDWEYRFNHKEGSVTAARGETAESFPIPSGTQDLISCLYYARSTLVLTPGESLTLNVHHDRKNRKVQVLVEAMEMISGPWGEVEAARVLVVMPFQGLFLNQGNIQVWFTTDDRRIPVRMKAKVMIGSIMADLVEGWSSFATAP